MAQGAAKKVKKRKPSVLKRARQTIKRAEVNRAKKTAVRTVMKRMKAMLAAGNAAEAEQLLRPTMSALDKAIQNGALKENTGNRYKSRLTIAVAAMKAGG